jgi:hypothetical protein
MGQVQTQCKLNCWLNSAQPWLIVEQCKGCQHLADIDTPNLTADSRQGHGGDFGHHHVGFRHANHSFVLKVDHKSDAGNGFMGNWDQTKSASLHHPGDCRDRARQQPTMAHADVDLVITDQAGKNPCCPRRLDKVQAQTRLAAARWAAHQNGALADQHGAGMEAQVPQWAQLSQCRPFHRASLPFALTQGWRQGGQTDGEAGTIQLDLAIGADRSAAVGGADHAAVGLDDLP